MHSKLLASFAAIALLGVSTVSYGYSWIRYVEGDGKVPNGDCLEMICANGCVEEDEKFYGYCCPGEGKAGDSCRVDSGEDVDECCGEGLLCEGGKCGCPTGTTLYTKLDGSNGCCSNTTHVLASIAGSASKACCPKETPRWGGSKCVGCLTNADCEGNQVCKADKTCGGCPTGTTLYTKLDGSSDCCTNTTYVLVSITGSASKACCPKETPVWNGTKCVESWTKETCESSGHAKWLIGRTAEIPDMCCPNEQITKKGWWGYEDVDSKTKLMGTKSGTHTMSDSAKRFYYCCNDDRMVIITHKDGDTECCPKTHTLWKVQRGTSSQGWLTDQGYWFCSNCPLDVKNVGGVTYVHGDGLDGLGGDIYFSLYPNKREPIP